MVSIGLLMAGNLLQAQETTTMSMKDCMAYAVSHSTKMRVQAADRSDEQITRRDALLTVFAPSVNANTYAYNYYGRNIDPETNTYVNTTSFNNGYSVSAGLVLFNGFKAVNNLKISNTMKRMGLSKDQQCADEICLAIMQAYYNAVFYGKMARVVERQVETAQRNLHLAQRKEEMGQIGHADVVQVEADLAERQLQLVNMRNAYADAMINLKDIMFWPTENDFDIDTVAVSCPVTFDEGAATADILDYAKANNPSVVIAEGALHNAALELKTTQWQLLPTLQLNGGWSTSYYTYPKVQDYVSTPFFEQLRNNSGEYLQLSLSFPLFDRLSCHSAIARKKNALKRAEAEYDQALKEVENEVLRAIQDKNGAVAAFQQADRLAELQARAFALNARKFEQGLISPIEYQTATEKYLEAQANQLDALLKYLLKCSVVRYYKGESFINQ